MIYTLTLNYASRTVVHTGEPAFTFCANANLQETPAATGGFQCLKTETLSGKLGAGFGEAEGNLRNAQFRGPDYEVTKTWMLVMFDNSAI